MSIPKNSPLSSERQSELQDYLNILRDPSQDDDQERLYSCNVAELEYLALLFPRRSKLSWNDKQLQDQILHIRKRLLNKQFVFTEENKQRLLSLNERLMKTLEVAREEVKKAQGELEEWMSPKDENLHDYEIDARVTPYILVPDEDGELGEPDDGILELLNYVLNDNLISFSFRGMDESIYFDTELNWAGYEHIGEGHLTDHYICYAMSNIFNHSPYSLEDILRINSLWTDILIEKQTFSEVF